jgi:hypothetical protein
VKVVFLGATRGMGRALARLMAQRGDRLFLLGRDPEELARSAQDLEVIAGGGKVEAALCDLLQPETVPAALDQATQGDRRASARYRDVLAPIGLGDEVRVALVSGGWCWGVLCLHRQASSRGFDDVELAALRHLAPYMAQGLRSSITVFATTPEPASIDGPGIIILGTDLAIISINPQAERWLAAIDESEWPTQSDLPMPVLAAAAHAAGHTQAMPPPTRLRRGQGGWLTVHASRLTGPAAAQTRSHGRAGHDHRSWSFASRPTLRLQSGDPLPQHDPRRGRRVDLQRRVINEARLDHVML